MAIIERLFLLTAGTCFSVCCCCGEVAIVERLFSLTAGTCFSGCCCCGEVAIVKRLFSLVAGTFLLVAVAVVERGLMCHLG